MEFADDSKLERIFDQALTILDAHEGDRFLADACAENTGLRREVKTCSPHMIEQVIF
ncbi:MAG: hypothetical protein R3F19_34260 [Verrucomicrobiales bacterium]|nr:hypothetical protein [Verrucomicrobiae bacterium]